MNQYPLEFFGLHKGALRQKARDHEIFDEENPTPVQVLLSEERGAYTVEEIREIIGTLGLVSKEQTVLESPDGYHHLAVFSAERSKQRVQLIEALMAREEDLTRKFRQALPVTVEDLELRTSQIEDEELRRMMEGMCRDLEQATDHSDAFNVVGLLRQLFMDRLRAGPTMVQSKDTTLLEEALAEVSLLWATHALVSIAKLPMDA